jgi:polycystin 2
MAAVFSGSGFAADFPAGNITNNVAKLALLKSNRWLDLQTRAVFVDFTVYNANLDLFCVVRRLCTMSWCWRHLLLAGICH